MCQACENNEVYAYTSEKRACELTQIGDVLEDMELGLRVEDGAVSQDDVVVLRHQADGLPARVFAHRHSLDVVLGLVVVIITDGVLAIGLIRRLLIPDRGRVT